jgi:uncharacterized protein (DUF2342 family)
MGLYESVRAVTTASGSGTVDWDAVEAAAKSSTEPGSLDLSPAARTAYADDVREARDRVRDVGGLAFDLPDTVEIQNRHHWIDANIGTFERVMAALEDREVLFADTARKVNSGTMAIALAFLGNNVLGQYDPLLLAERDDHALYFVHPNIERVADELDVGVERFRRWIAFHEVAHAAEFGAAPWLSDRLETAMHDAIDAIGKARVARSSLAELDTTMTAVEGYAELVMDRTFDGEYVDLRAKVDERRRGRGPVSKLIRRLFGLGMKRRQYERGKAFFEAVADARDVAFAARVWEGPTHLPSATELDTPHLWIDRVES